MAVKSPVKSTVDPTMAGQEDIVRPDDATKGSNAKTSKTGGRPEAEALAMAVQHSEKSLEPYRWHWTLFRDRFAGAHYGHGDSDNPDPMNLLYSLVTTLVPALSVDPKATVSTVAGDLAFAETFRLAIDDELDRITLAKTIKLVITDSLFGLGIIKTGLKAGPGFEDEGNLEIDAGTIFSGRVSFLNYIIDMAGMVRENAQFEGDRYSINEDAARDSGMFDEAVLQQLIAASETQRQNGIAEGKEGYDDEFIRRLYLVDLYLPTKKQVVTIPGDVMYSSFGYLREVDWDGDPSGPYDTTGFSPVPDKILPTPVIGAIYDLYQFVNKMGRKVVDQAERAKDIAVYQLGNEGDGDAIKDADDGHMIGLRDVEGVKVLSFGGAKDEGYKVIAWAQDLLNQIAGNPDLIGGLKADANTLGQDQLSLQNANARIDDWRQTALDTCSSVLRKIAGYIWTDKDTNRSLELKEGQFTFPREFGRDRDGEFEDYRIGIDAHHRPPMSPDQKYLRKQRWITEILIPLSEAAASQGLVLDVDKVAQTTGRDLGIEDASEMFVPAEDVPRLQQQQQQQGRSPENPEQGPRLSQPKPALEGV